MEPSYLHSISSLISQVKWASLVCDIMVYHLADYVQCRVDMVWVAHSSDIRQ